MKSTVLVHTGHVPDALYLPAHRRYLDRFVADACSELLRIRSIIARKLQEKMA